MFKDPECFMTSHGLDHGVEAPSKQFPACLVLLCLLRFRAMRKRHIRIMIANPRAKPRHEVINTKLFVETQSQQFCDVYQARPLHLLFVGHHSLSD